MRRTMIVLILAAASACGSTTTTASDALRGNVADGLDEDQSYLAMANTVTTMPGMLVVVDLHTVHFGKILDDMNGHMDSMQQCMGYGPMAGMRDDLQAEVSSHQAAEHAITSVPAALTEIQRHVDAMQTMMTDMDGMLDGMSCD
jgi:hypothetical protein